MKLNPNASFAWLPAVAFTAASAWPLFSQAPFPLRGLRNLSEQPVLLGAPLVLLSVALALFLSFERWHTRRRLLACGIFSLVLGVVVLAFAAMVAAPPFLLIGMKLCRENRRGAAPVTPA